MPEEIKRINLYPGLFPRKSNWADLQTALFTNIADKWAKTKSYGVVSGLTILNVDLPNKRFDVSQGFAFDSASDFLAIDAAGATQQYDAALPVAVDNQFPPQSIAQSSGAKYVPMQINIGTGAPVDTYVFIQSVETIDLAATNRHRPGRVYQYPKIDFGYKIVTTNITNAIANINAASVPSGPSATPPLIFLGVIKVNGTFSTVLTGFTKTTSPGFSPIDAGFAYYQVPRLLGNDPRDMVAGGKHDHAGPYVKGQFMFDPAVGTGVPSPSASVRIRVLSDTDPNDYDDFFIGTGNSDQVFENGSQWLTSPSYLPGAPVVVGQAYEFAVPVGRFQGKRIRVMLSSTGFFRFPNFATNNAGTPSSRAQLSTNEKNFLQRTYWNNLRLEPNKELSNSVETVYFPNYDFEYFINVGSIGTISPLYGDGVDCVIPGWTVAAGTNLPNRMAIVLSSFYAPSFPNAGNFLLCTYSSAAADPGSSTLGKAGTVFGTGGNAQQYTVVDVPYTGFNAEATELELAETDWDNRSTQSPAPGISPFPGGANSVTDAGISFPQADAVVGLLPTAFGSLTTRGVAGITSFTKNKWNSLSTHFQHLWGRFLEHDHSSRSGVQQVVTDGIANESVVLAKLSPLLTAPAPGVAGLVPPGMICLSFTGSCPAGWTNVTPAGSFLIAAPAGTAGTQNGTVARAASLSTLELVKNATISVGGHSHVAGNSGTGDAVQVEPGGNNDPYCLNNDPIMNPFTSPAGGFSVIHNHNIPVFAVTLCQK